MTLVRATAAILLSAFIVSSLQNATASTVSASPSPTPSASPEPAPAPIVTSERYQREESEIPKNPSAPPQIGRHVPGEVFNTCLRHFIYRDKVMNCDSNVRQDGEGLRPIISSVPDAVAELDTYQHNRKAVLNAAYVGSLGFASAIILYYTGRNITNPVLSLTLKELGIVGGLGLTAVSFSYSVFIITTNESHLNKAVDIYNAARPTDPILIQFSTKISL